MVAKFRERMAQLPQTFVDAFARERDGTYGSETGFDDALWTLTCRAVKVDPKFQSIPEPLMVYYVTRYLTWEIGNGGFAQAAMNVPHLFEPAALGYETLGRPDLSAFIREVSVVVKSEADRIKEAAITGDDTFAYFREGTFARFDEQTKQNGWYDTDGVRLEYVKTHEAEIVGWERSAHA
jgi:hypothetical protein